MVGHTNFPHLSIMDFQGLSGSVSSFRTYLGNIGLSWEDIGKSLLRGLVHHAVAIGMICSGLYCSGKAF